MMRTIELDFILVVFFFKFKLCRKNKICYTLEKIQFNSRINENVSYILNLDTF